jgi:hypothetical protein
MDSCLVDYEEGVFRKEDCELHLLFCNGRFILELMITEGNKQKRQSRMTLPP